MSRFHARRTGWLVAAAAAITTLLPAAALAQSADEAAIRGVRAESNAAIARRDVPGILASLDPTYRVTTSSGSLFTSPAELGEAIAAQYEAFEDAVYVRTPERVEVSASGPIAAETGRWVGTWTTSNGPFRTGGRYLAYWTKTDGEWRIFSELFVPLFCEGTDCD